MSITIGDKPEMNVVNVGDEISTNQLAAITGASNPSASNVLITNSALTTSLNTKANLAANTFTGLQFIESPGSTSSAALRINSASSTTVSSTVGLFYVSVLNAATIGHAVVIENRGTGDCLRILDQASDSVNSMFRVMNDGIVHFPDTALNSDVGAQTYANELTIRCGGSTYRVPARLISTP